MRRYAFKILSACLVAAFLLFAAFAAGGADASSALPTIAELNTNSANGDHAEDDMMRVSLEPDFRSSTELTYAATGYSWFDEMNYPRIKQWKEDLYVLLFSTSRTGNQICYTTSTDGRIWAAPVSVWTTSQHRYGIDDYYIASGLEACMLDNGEILYVFAVRPKFAYKYDIDANGLYIMRGGIDADNELTFGTPQKIYTGQCWEPSILQRSDGTVGSTLRRSRRTLRNIRSIRKSVPAVRGISFPRIGDIHGRRTYSRATPTIIAQPRYCSSTSATKRVCSAEKALPLPIFRDRCR